MFNALKLWKLWILHLICIYIFIFFVFSLFRTIALHSNYWFRFWYLQFKKYLEHHLSLICGRFFFYLYAMHLRLIPQMYSKCKPHPIDPNNLNLTGHHIDFSNGNCTIFILWMNLMLYFFKWIVLLIEFQLILLQYPNIFH